jgi:hypothetical protein
MITPFIGLFLLIVGGVGLFVTNTNFIFGDPFWIQGNITFGAFAFIGLVIIICIIISGPEID